MLDKAREREQPTLPAAAGTGHNAQGGRFARDPSEYAHSRTTTATGGRSVQLTLIPGGADRQALTSSSTEPETR
jgi:hypothetical protein